MTSTTGMGTSASNWRKASRSVNNGACVEVASDDDVLVRDSADVSDSMISYPAPAWRDFLAAAKTDTFAVTRQPAAYSPGEESAK
jgi:hypothetical protein